MACGRRPGEAICSTPRSSELFEASGAPAGVALAAIGGYGRRQQLPRSDVDLLVLHEGDRLDEVAGLVERLLYPLWDAGFEVGHAVRTAEECVVARPGAPRRAARRCSICGTSRATAVARRCDRARRCARSRRTTPTRFAEVLRPTRRAGAANAWARPRILLEPDLKSGAGGLRDLQALAVVRSRQRRSLWSGAGLLRPRERTALDDAEEFLTRVRSALHLETGKRTDRLPLELQPPIARAMGFTDEPRLLAEDGLMRAVFEHARAVRWIAGERVGPHARAGAVPRPVAADRCGPAAVLDALADAAETEAPPSPALLDAIEHVDLAAEVEWTDGGPRSLPAAPSSVARPASRRSRPSIASGCWCGSSPRGRTCDAVPNATPTTGSPSMRTSPRRGRDASDADAAGGEDPIEREMVKQVDDRRRGAARRAAPRHRQDGRGRPRADRGPRSPTETLERMGVEPSTRELASFMVREHLLLPDTATRRDLTDENLILDVAATVGNPGTARGAVSAGQGRRARDRAGRVDAVATDADPRARGTRPARVRTRRHGGRAGGPAHRTRGPSARSVDRRTRRRSWSGSCSACPARTSWRWNRRRLPDTSPRSRPTWARARSGPPPWQRSRPGSYELLVVAADRPGLLSWIAGSLALAGPLDPVGAGRSPPRTVRRSTCSRSTGCSRRRSRRRDGVRSAGPCARRWRGR